MRVAGIALAASSCILLQGCGPDAEKASAPTTSPQPSQSTTSSSSTTSSAPCAPSTSITSCGGASDHLKNVCIQLSPEPITKGAPFTLSFSGDLDEDLDGGEANLDLDVTALGGVIDEKVKKTSPFTLSPAAKKGNQNIVIGPVTLPNEPGAGKVTGKVSITNSKKEPVACVNLNLEIPGQMDKEAIAWTNFFEKTAGDKTLQSASPSAADPVTSCTQPGDHLKNFNLATTGGVTTISGTFDEDVAKTTVDIDLVVEKFIVKVPLKMTIPTVIYLVGYLWLLVPGTASFEEICMQGSRPPYRPHCMCVRTCILS
eukprot:TRINITY_DN20914_c0_g1_i2.p1 TRINITY_DN20914_c0_g1~~TRINITY_DN20914_c0_g1_i2.p1  ORF type:complete len:314 (-),score=68.07 TRINITY_DN20914_c0_g1_i2:434-1375(-)